MNNNEKIAWAGTVLFLFAPCVFLAGFHEEAWFMFAYSAFFYAMNHVRNGK